MGNILILGVGNILLSDEGVGVRVVEELRRRYAFPPNVEVVEGGTAAFQLLTLIEEADHLIVVDAAELGAAPGTIFRAEFREGGARFASKTSLHEVGLLEVLSLAQLHSRCPPTVIIGMQPKDFSPSLSLCPELEASIPSAVEAVLAEMEKLGAGPIGPAERPNECAESRGPLVAGFLALQLI